MSIESDIQTMLKTNAAFTSMPMHFATDPQTVPLPKVTFARIAGKRQYSNDGDTGVAVVNLQLNFIANSLNDAKTLAQTALAVFDANAAATFGATRFAGIFLEAGRDIEVPVEGGLEKPLQISILSIRVNCYDALS